MFVLNEMLEIDKLCSFPKFSDHSRFDMVLTEADRFAKAGLYLCHSVSDKHNLQLRKIQTCRRKNMKDSNTVGASSSPHMDYIVELTSVLPAHTRGAMAIDIGNLLAGNSSAEVADLLNGNGTDAALNEPFCAITAYSLGIDIKGTMETVLLAHTTHARDLPILVAKLNRGTLAEIIDVGTLTDGFIYKTHAVYTEPSSGLDLTMLPKGVLIVGQAANVKSIIDVYMGDADNAAASAEVGAYLSDLAMDQSVAFVYGLPGMFRKIESGLTLNGAQAISVQLGFSKGTLSGEASFYTVNAYDFASTYNEATANHSRPPLVAFPAVVGRIERLVIPIPVSDINKSEDEIVSSRHPLKMLFYIMEAKNIADGIASGATHPCKNFFVDGYPPSVFINYEIPEEQVAAFSAAALPMGFEMTKLRLLESDKHAYYLSLNIYTTMGMTSGVRFEWSIFVKDPAGGKPRFLVIKALAEQKSIDPSAEDFFTPPEPVTHKHENGLLISEALQDRGNGMENYFTSTIKWPQDAPQVDRTTREFITANDLIYWGGGVCDHVLYSGSMHNRDVTIIPPGDYTIKDETPLAAFVKPVPTSVYVYQNELDYMFLPWENLDTDDLEMGPDRVKKLSVLKRKLFSRLIVEDTVKAFNAEDDAVLAFDLNNTIPAVFFNYVIPAARVAAFEAVLGLPKGYSLAKTRILESGSREKYYLTLNVFCSDDVFDGTRAEWSVYVDDGDGREHFMIINLMTSGVVLDPVSLLHLPSVVEHNLSGDFLTTILVSPTIDFKAKLNVTNGSEELQTLDWVEAKDFVYYLNGICDKYYFGEGSLETPLLSIRPSSVTVSATTPWSDFIDSEPDSVLLRTNKQSFVKKAWYNVQPAKPIVENAVSR